MTDMDLTEACLFYAARRKQVGAVQAAAEASAQLEAERSTDPGTS